MAPRPSSPTSLLWAHQLKREHGYLLERVQQVEAAGKQHEERLKTAETTAIEAAHHDVAALSEQVKALSEDGIKKRLAKVEKDVVSKLEAMEAEGEATMLKVASLEKDKLQAEDEKRKNFIKEKALLTRMNDLEAGLAAYQRTLESAGRQVDDENMKKIMAQLDSLCHQVKKGGAEMIRLEGSVRLLEAANKELREVNDNLAAKVVQMAARRKSVPPELPSRPASADIEQTPQGDLDEDDDETSRRKKKKKSHKWAGGGADRDIIGQSPDLFKKPSRPQRAIPRPTLPPEPVITKPKEQPKKPVAKHIRKSDTQAGSKAASKQLQKPVPAKLPRKSDPQTVGEPEKPVIRAGKGWFEVAVTPSQSEPESQESNTSVKRPRGRPRRQPPRQDTLDQLHVEGQRLTRNARQQLTQGRAIPQKRKAEDDEPADVRRKERGTAMKTAKKAQSKGKEEPDVFSSPVTSPQRGTTQLNPPAKMRSKDALLGAAPVPAAAAPRRRVIEQVDYGQLLEKYMQ